MPLTIAASLGLSAQVSAKRAQNIAICLTKVAPLPYDAMAAAVRHLIAAAPSPDRDAGPGPNPNPNQPG